MLTRNIRGGTFCEIARANARAFLDDYMVGRAMIQLAEEDGKIVPTDAEYEVEVSAGKNLMRRVEEVISAVPGRRERFMLECVYMKCRPVERASEQLGVSPRTGYRIFNRALDSCARIIGFTGKEVQISFFDPMP